MDSSDKTNKTWVDALHDIQSSRGNKPPEDDEEWKSMEEIIEIMGVGRTKAYKIVSKGVEQGKIQTYEGSSLNASGSLVRRVWYKIK